jgi:signal recognition particle receptor subunit beta
LSSNQNANATVRGIIFMVDAASLSEGDEPLRDAAVYLHDTLMVLQERTYNSRKRFSKSLPSVPVLVAANKQDLFTALPPGSVRDKLETEIEKVRQSRRKGLLDASVDLATSEGEQDMLGGDEGQGKFSFKILENSTGIKVDVMGGAVKSDEDVDVGSGVRRWEEWIGSCL